MAVISFDDKRDSVWGGAGWAFRQILRDLSPYAQGDTKFQEALVEAEHLGSLVIDTLDADLRERITHGILSMCRELAAGTRLSSIKKHHPDGATQDLYWQELERLESAAKAPSSAPPPGEGSTP